MSSNEMYEKYGFHRKKLKDLRDYGLLVGTKYGHGYSYLQKDVDEFFEKTRGLNCSNRAQIAITAMFLSKSKTKKEEA